MSSSSQRDGWVRTSLVSMVWRRAIATSLPLLSSSRRARAREDRVGEEEGEDSGEDVGEVCSGELGGLGRGLCFFRRSRGG